MDALNWSKVTLKTFRLLCIIVFTKLAELFSTLIIIFSKKIDLLEWFLKDYVTHKIITTINVYLFKGLDKDVSYTDVKLMHTVLLNKSNFCHLSAILPIMVAIFFFCCPHVTLFPPFQLVSFINHWWVPAFLPLLFYQPLYLSFYVHPLLSITAPYVSNT